MNNLHIAFLWTMTKSLNKKNLKHGLFLFSGRLVWPFFTVLICADAFISFFIIAFNGVSFHMNKSTIDKAFVSLTIFFMFPAFIRSLKWIVSLQVLMVVRFVIVQFLERKN